MDSSTDSGNKEQELTFVTYCHRNVKTFEMRSHTRSLTIVSPSTSNSDGLVNCLQGVFADLFDIDISKKTVF